MFCSFGYFRTTKFYDNFTKLQISRSRGYGNFMWTVDTPPTKACNKSSTGGVWFSNRVGHYNMVLELLYSVLIDQKKYDHCSVFSTGLLHLKSKNPEWKISQKTFCKSFTGKGWCIDFKHNWAGSLLVHVSGLLNEFKKGNRVSFWPLF